MLEVSIAPQEILATDLLGQIEAGGGRSFAQALAAYDLSPRDAQLPELVVRTGESLVLRQRLTAHPRSTAEVATFKRWIGTDDATVEHWPPGALPELPSRDWPSGRAVELDVLGEGEWADVQRAARAYLFGHSKMVASYERVIERFYAPFEADVFVLPRLVVEPGATLVVSGRPTALLVGELLLHEGGSIQLKTIVKAWVESLTRFTQAWM